MLSIYAGQDAGELAAGDRIRALGQVIKCLTHFLQCDTASQTSVEIERDHVDLNDADSMKGKRLTSLARQGNLGAHDSGCITPKQFRLVSLIFHSSTSFHPNLTSHFPIYR
jgi:hypothetical protein